MKTERMDVLLEATSGIRDQYIEEAACAKPARPRWVGFAAAAVLAILIILAGLLWPTESENAPVPLLAIHAYAADGNTVMLEDVGDNVFLESQTSDLFPGKTVYVLDVSLEGYTGNLEDLADGSFRLFHRGKWLRPGESDEFLSVRWLSEEEDGMFGYRIVGWCETSSYISLVIYGEEYKILHEKEMIIINEDGYQANMLISYTHRDDRTTDELIDAVMRQNYGHHLMLSSNFDQRILLSHTGFRELTQRPDAASKLLDLFIRSQNGEQLFITSDFFGEGTACNDGLLGTVLSWDEFWVQLTPEEQALARGYGCLRHTLYHGREAFPGKKAFSHTLYAPGDAKGNLTLEVSYNGKAAGTDDEHIVTFWLLRNGEDGQQENGWTVVGWFEEPTELILTVKNRRGTIFLQQILTITPTENGYRIDIQDETL